MFSRSCKSEGNRGKGLWKRNNSLCENTTSPSKNLNNENITHEQSVWEYSKYEIRKLSKNFTNKTVRSNKIKYPALETKLKILESKIINSDNLEYIHYKGELDKPYRGKINSAMVRRRYDCCEHGKIS